MSSTDNKIALDSTNHDMKLPSYLKRIQRVRRNLQRSKLYFINYGLVNFTREYLGCALSLALSGIRIPGIRFRNTKIKISKRLIYSIL
jgi:hypothetical protein